MGILTTKDLKLIIYMKFTIVTVTYNSENLLEKTIQSVINQTCKDYEYIIIDGKSTDKTVEIIKRYDSVLTHWVSEKDNGIYDAMNKAIGIATGDWIIFLNSGDYFVNNEVLDILSMNADSSKYDIIYSDILVEKKGEVIQKVAAEPCNKQRMYFCHQAAVTKTAIMKEMPFDTRFKMSADLFFFKQCYYKNYRFKHIPKPLVFYDKTGVSNTNRLAGLYDNVAVIKAIDKAPQKQLFLLKLYFVIYWNRLRKSRH